MIPLVQNVGIAILQAMNLNRYRMTVYSLCAFIALGFSFPLAQYYDGFGCAVATAVSLIVSTGLFMNRYYARRVKLDIARFWRNILAMTKGMVLLVIAGGLVKYLLCLSLSWGNLLFMVVICTFFYIVIMYLWCMNDDERGLCRRLVGKLSGGAI